MTKAEREQKKEVALIYYMNGDEQKVIAEKVGISEVTISKWAKEGAWAERRGAVSVSRQEIIKTLLITSDSLAHQLKACEDEVQHEKLSNRLAKLSKTIDTLDKGNGIVSTVECFIKFSRWCSQKAQTDNAITTDFLKELNRLQDKFINETLI